MPYELDRLRPTLAADNDALIYAALPGASVGMQFAETRVEPIAVPRPQPFDTVTIGVVTGRPLKLEFPVGEVQTREVVRDDLILGFENGGKVVLKDYMHAFGLLGDQRTTIIQPDGKHYAFTELLAPADGAKPEEPAASPNVLIVEKPGPGETQRFKLSTEKPTALNFGKDDIAQSQVSREGDLILTFKDRGVLVLEGYSALRGSADIALYYTKGDKVALGDLAPGAGPEAAAPEGGHLFTQFDPGGALGPLDHLGALGPEPVSLISPPGPPGSPPAVPPPPHAHSPEPPPETPPPPKAVNGLAPEEEPGDEAEREIGAAAESSADGLTLIVAAGMDVGGDVETESGRWGAKTSGAQTATFDADTAPLGWIKGHDSDPPALAALQGAAFGAAQMASTKAVGEGETGEAAPMSSQEIFDSGDSAPEAAPAHADAGAGAIAAAQDFAAMTAHAESQAPQVQNPAQHNVMGHG
jgi:hypothetical protein